MNTNEMLTKVDNTIRYLKSRQHIEAGCELWSLEHDLVASVSPEDRKRRERERWETSFGLKDPAVELTLNRLDNVQHITRCLKNDDFIEAGWALSKLQNELKIEYTRQPAALPDMEILKVMDTPPASNTEDPF